MKHSTYIGQTFVATVLEPIINSGLIVVCYPGYDEAFGKNDGSLLPKINYGFNESAEWPFTILKVQTLTTNFSTSWVEIMKYIDDHATNAVVIGWSLGAREAMDLLLGFKGRVLSSKVKLVVAIDGPASGTPDYAKASVPVIMVTGKNGDYYYPLRTQKEELLKLNKQVNFIGDSLLDHKGLRDLAYSSTTILKQITDLIVGKVEPRVIVSSTVNGNTITFTDDQGLKYTVPVTVQP